MCKLKYCIFVLISLMTIMVVLGVVSVRADKINWENRVVRYNGKPSPENIIQIYAHRGIRHLLPENSLPCEIAAMRLGVDYIDIDVVLTKNKVLVSAHDMYTRWYIATKKGLSERAMPLPGADGESAEYLRKHKEKFLYTMTYKELIDKYSIGSDVKNSNYGKIFKNQAAFKYMSYFNASDITDIVKKYGGKRIGSQIELKSDPENFPEVSPSSKEYAEIVYKLIKEKDIIDQTEIQSFDWSILIELERLDKNVKTAFLTEANADYTNKNVNQIKWTAGHYLKDDYNNGKGHKSVPHMIKDLGSDYFEPFAACSYDNPDQIKTAHDLGLKVVPWCWSEKFGKDYKLAFIDGLVKRR